MQTRLLEPDGAAVAEAARLLRGGQVVGMPTETVYGLAANAMDEAAVRRIFEAKGRPQDNPLIVHISDMEMLGRVWESVPKAALALAEAFWPGPLTMVWTKAEDVAPSVSAGLGTIGVRIPEHIVAREMIREAGVPLAAPSGNLSGRPSPTTAAHMMRDMAGRIPLVIDGGACDVGVESTVLALGDVSVVLRPGVVTAKQIEKVLGREVATAEAVTRPLGEGERALSPGMKYRHYAPRAQLTLVEGDIEEFAEYVSTQAGPGVWALCFEGEQHALGVPAVVYGCEGDDDSQAAALFGALRQLDDEDAKQVYVRAPRHDGVGLAVYNRLLRAAAFRVVEL